VAKKVATPKQVGGGGYTFEDKVAASLLLKMLTGDYPLNPADGQIEAVGFQKRRRLRQGQVLCSVFNESSIPNGV